MSASTSEPRYNTQQCEGCRGGGTRDWDCEGRCEGSGCGNSYETSDYYLDGRCYCNCTGCTGDDRCGGCGGYGTYDPDPQTVAEVDEQARLDQEAQDELESALDAAAGGAQ